MHKRRPSKLSASRALLGHSHVPLCTVLALCFQTACTATAAVTRSASAFFQPTGAGIVFILVDNCRCTIVVTTALNEVAVLTLSQGPGRPRLRCTCQNWLALFARPQYCLPALASTADRNFSTVSWQNFCTRTLSLLYIAACIRASTHF